jgi:hypothetical protein
MCFFQIDPRFDKKYCVKQMIQCTNKSTNFDNCSEYWEPLSYENRLHSKDTFKDFIQSVWVENQKFRSEIEKAKILIEQEDMWK